MRDEVYEPLGFPLNRTLAVDGRPRRMSVAFAVAVLALVVSSLSLAVRLTPMRERVAAGKAPAASAPRSPAPSETVAEPPVKPETAEPLAHSAAAPPSSPTTAPNQVEAASVRVTSRTVPGAPVPLIINVQEALAKAKLKAALAEPR